MLDGGLRGPARRAAVQHRRRRPVQQPPRQPRRDDQDHRGGAPAPRGGPSGGAGAGLQLALAHGTGGALVDADDGGDGRSSGRRTHERRGPLLRTSAPTGQPGDRRRSGTPRPRDGWRCQRCDECEELIWYPRRFCPFCGSRSVTMVRCLRARHGLQVHDHARGGGPFRDEGAVRAGLRRARRGAGDDDQHRRCDPGSRCTSARR